MTQKTGKKPPPKAMRWGDAEWAWLAEVAKSVGVSRSEFVRRSAIIAAQATAAGMTPYFVEGAAASQQNTRINLFSGEAGQKLATGGGQDAGSRSRSDGAAKGAPTNEAQNEAPQGRRSKRS